MSEQGSLLAPSSNKTMTNNNYIILFGIFSKNLTLQPAIEETLIKKSKFTSKRKSTGINVTLERHGYILHPS